MKAIKSAFLFPPGSIAVFDVDGNQVPELQGNYSIDKHMGILVRATSLTQIKGFEDIPVKWVDEGRVNNLKERYYNKKLNWDDIKNILNL